MVELSTHRIPVSGKLQIYLNICDSPLDKPDGSIATPTRFSGLSTGMNYNPLIPLLHFKVESADFSSHSRYTVIALPTGAQVYP